MLPQDVFTNLPENLGARAKAVEHGALRESVFGYVQAFKELATLPVEFNSLRVLTDKIPGFIQAFSKIDEISANGMSYQIEASSTTAAHDSFSEFIRCCARWCQRSSHQTGGVAWGEIAEQWLLAFSNEFTRIAYDRYNAFPENTYESDYVTFAICPADEDPEITRCLHEARTHKIVMVLLPENPEENRFRFKVSLGDFIALGSLIEQEGESLGLSLEGSDVTMGFPWESLGGTSEVEAEAIALFRCFSASKHPIHDIAQAIDHSYTPKVATQTLTARMSDLSLIADIHQAFNVEHKKSQTRQLPVELVLDGLQDYYCSFSGATESHIRLIDLIHSNKYKNIRQCTLWGNENKNVGVTVDTSWLREHFQQGFVRGRLLQRKPGSFVLRTPIVSIAKYDWPTPGVNQRESALSDYRQHYTESAQYIRDPLQMKDLKDTLSQIGDPNSLSSDAISAMITYMNKMDVHCHLSFESVSDPLSGIPYFMNMNIYRTSSNGAFDCRSVSVFINSHHGIQHTLSEIAASDSGLSQDDFKHIGVSSESADALFCKAIRRASASNSGKFTSQWENANHQSRQLMPYLPDLFSLIMTRPIIDTTRLTRIFDLTAKPTHTVQIPITPKLKVGFEDAWGSISPFTLNGFLSSSNQTSISSTDGRFIMHKMGESFIVTSADQQSNYPLTISPDELRQMSLKQPKRAVAQHNPSTSDAILDRKKIVHLLNVSAPSYRYITQFEIPSWVSVEHPIYNQVHTLQHLFVEWSKNVSLDMAFELQVEQFIQTLPEDPSLHPESALGGGEGSFNGKQFIQTLDSINPQFVDAMQYGYSSRDLRQAYLSAGARLDPKDATFTFKHLIRWNIQRFHNDNSHLLAHYHQMAIAHRILSDLEPNTKIAPKALFSDISDASAIPISTIESIYKQAYQIHMEDPLQKNYLPSKTPKLPLMRELLLRDISFWSSLSNHAQAKTIFPELTPMLKALNDDSLNTHIQWWIEQSINPATQGSLRNNSHRMKQDGVIYIRPDIMREHQQHLTVETSVQISNEDLRNHVLPTFNAALSVMRLQNSLPNVYRKHYSDLTFQNATKDVVVDNIIEVLKSSEITGLLRKAAHYLNQMKANDLYVEDDGQYNKYFKVFCQHLISANDSPVPRPIPLAAAAAIKMERDIATFYESFTQNTLDGPLMGSLEKELKKCITLSLGSEWMHSIIAQRNRPFVISDDTTSQRSGLTSIYTAAGKTFDLVTQQQLIIFLLENGQKTCPLPAPELTELHMFSISGKMPTEGSLSKMLIRSFIASHQQVNLLELPPNLKNLSQTFTLKSDDPCRIYREFQIDYPSLHPAKGEHVTMTDLKPTKLS